ncbi:MAG TPA: FHA domain-containing protein [Planctomycetota bacterium]|nr:FHA domain-containing protein [Planctomycetota bacterium]
MSEGEPEASLLVEEEGVVRRVRVASLPATFGRGPECDVVLGGSEVSRAHFRLERTPLGCAVVDLESANGTLLDGARVRRALLKRGAELRAGATRLVYLGGASEPAPLPVAEPSPRTVPAAAPAVGSPPPPPRDPEEGPAEPAPPPPPPMSAKSKAVANVVTLILIAGLNGALFLTWDRIFQPKAPPAAPEAPPQPRPVDEPPVDLAAERERRARSAWFDAASVAKKHVAAERYGEALDAMRGFLAEHGDSKSAGQALERIDEIARERNGKVENCLAHAERMVELKDPAAAAKSVELARRLAAGDESERLRAVAAKVDAALKAAASRPPRK